MERTIGGVAAEGMRATNVRAGDHDIRMCRAAELPAVQSFIDAYWKSRHILVLSSKLMKWQHWNEQRGDYNFVIAVHQMTGEIHGILGFIPTRQFDPSISHTDVCLAIWIVRRDIHVAGLGLALYGHMIKETRPDSIMVLSMSQEVAPIYRSLGFKVGQLNHYYMVNVEKRIFHLIGGFEGRYSSDSKPSSVTRTLVRYEKNVFHARTAFLPQVGASRQRPAKSFTYLYNRYLEHPAYQYQLYGIVEGDTTLGLIVMRRTSHAPTSALRIVDYYGEATGLLGTFGAFQTLLKESDAEYVDCYNVGLDEEVFSGAGFIRRTASAQVIIPNYFEPFEQRNVDLEYAYRFSSGEAQEASAVWLFKGDSDQDRPNILLEALKA